MIRIGSRSVIAEMIAAAILAVSAASGVCAGAPSGLGIERLRCEYDEDPLSVNTLHPRFSWQSESKTRGQRQTAYQIFVADSEDALKSDQGNLWDSGKVVSGSSVGIVYAGAPLHSAQQCWWKVRVWDKDGKTSRDSDVGHWQMGLLMPSDWKAQWIAAQTPRNVTENKLVLPPSAYLRRTFTLTKPVKHATLFVTARGLYEMHLNGKRLGDAFMTPGWTDYPKHIQYQGYDVTSSLKNGDNTLGAIMGDGWYSGYVGFARQRDNYGSVPQLLAQMEIEYADGSHDTIGTDGQWQGGTGPILYSDMLMGELYDARKVLDGWDTPKFDASAWKTALVNPQDSSVTHQVDVTNAVTALVKDNKATFTVDNKLAGDPAYNTKKQLRVEYEIDRAPHTQTIDENTTVTIPAAGEPAGTVVIRKAIYGALDQAPAGPPVLAGSEGPPVRVTQEIKPISVTKLASGAYLYDLGQNMVGWARLKVKAPAGTEIGMRFGEMLKADGTLYTTNLRSARATDTYICSGDGDETFEPHFTFHGFRYIEVSGFPYRPKRDAIVGCVVGSDNPTTGTFTSSSPLVNKLQQNIDWGQRGNFLSVPTDCPQRDERLGWMGDAQIFVRTATYNRDVVAFYEKWMQDVDDGQSVAGGFADVSPRIVDRADGAPAWGDAGVIVPWTVYQAYGDTEILRQNWPSMVRWLDYITSVNSDGLWMNRRNNDFGDWLSIKADTPKDVLATAYYAYDAQLMARMARVLGKNDEAASYDALFEKIKTAFNAAFVASDGRIKGDTQTCYVLALRFNLMPDALRAAAGQFLTNNIFAKNSHLSTGFVGVGYLCPVLTETGHNDMAYKLLLNDTFPSWGYSIKQGATTIWERWDGFTQEKGFQDPGMNSFNHYSLGSVGQWLYQYVAGIDTDPDQPGYKHILMHPHPGPGLTAVDATFESVYGNIASHWMCDSDKLTWDITVPANTSATVWVPTSDASSVTEGGKSVAGIDGITPTRTEPGFAVFEVQSGTYHFTAKLPAAP